MITYINVKPGRKLCTIAAHNIKIMKVSMICSFPLAKQFACFHEALEERRDN